MLFRLYFRNFVNELVTYPEKTEKFAKSHSLQYGAQINFNILFRDFDWRHQIGIQQRSIEINTCYSRTPVLTAKGGRTKMSLKAFFREVTYWTGLKKKWLLDLVVVFNLSWNHKWFFIWLWCYIFGKQI